MKTPKAISIIVLTAFLTTSLNISGYAKDVSLLPAPGVMVHLSPEFTPAHLKGIVIHPDNALKFDFIINKGDKPLDEVTKKAEYTKLIKYFLASLAVPDDNQWVNLSPYEKNRIIKEDFGKTEMGRDLLAQDYLLKQITASLIYPQDKLGQKFWDEVYAKAQQQFGTTNIPVNTFNKVWIVPDDAVIYEKGNTAYVIKHHLKVMLEEDYLSLGKHGGIQEKSIRDSNKAHAIGSQVVREVVLPQLEKEVNEGQNFAPLRQVYSGMLLAAWYKRALKESLLSKIYADKSKIKGINQDPKNNEAIYQQYLKAFKKGVFNFIKEDVDKYSKQTIPRKYFSGGTIGDGAMFAKVVRIIKTLDPAQAASLAKSLASDDLAQVMAHETQDSAMSGTEVNFSWNNGKNSFQVKRGTMLGGYKLHNILMNGKPTTVKLGNLQGSILRIEGAETLIIGKDKTSNQYVFITGDRDPSMPRNTVFYFEEGKGSAPNLLVNKSVRNGNFETIAILMPAQGVVGKQALDVQNFSDPSLLLSDETGSQKLPVGKQIKVLDYAQLTSKTAGQALSTLDLPPAIPMPGATERTIRQRIITDIHVAHVLDRIREKTNREPDPGVLDGFIDVVREESNDIRAIELAIEAILGAHIEDEYLMDSFLTELKKIDSTESANNYIYLLSGMLKDMSGLELSMNEKVRNVILNLFYIQGLNSAPEFRSQFEKWLKRFIEIGRKGRSDVEIDPMWQDIKAEDKEVFQSLPYSIGLSLYKVRIAMQSNLHINEAYRDYESTINMVNQAIAPQGASQKVLPSSLVVGTEALILNSFLTLIPFVLDSLNLLIDDFKSTSVDDKLTRVKDLLIKVEFLHGKMIQEISSESINGGMGLSQRGRDLKELLGNVDDLKVFLDEEIAKVELMLGERGNMHQIDRNKYSAQRLNRTLRMVFYSFKKRWRGLSSKLDSQGIEIEDIDNVFRLSLKRQEIVNELIQEHLSVEGAEVDSTSSLKEIGMFDDDVISMLDILEERYRFVVPTQDIKLFRNRLSDEKNNLTVNDFYALIEPYWSTDEAMSVFEVKKPMDKTILKEPKRLRVLDLLQAIEEKPASLIEDKLQARDLAKEIKAVIDMATDLSKLKSVLEGMWYENEYKAIPKEIPEIKQSLDLIDEIFRLREQLLVSSDSKILDDVISIKNQLSRLVKEAVRKDMADDAMKSIEPQYKDPLGGIDLNAANLNLQIKRDGNGVPLPISQQNLESIHIEGLIPVILDIRPALGALLLSELTSGVPQLLAKK